MYDIAHRGSTVTAVVLFAVVIFSGAWDVYVAIRYGDDATITAVIQDWGMRFPILPLLVGIVMGHLFWPRR